MQTGTIKDWVSGRRFGFIKRDDGGPDVFCHINQFTRRAEPFFGDRVRFEIGISARTGKPEAQNVELLDD